MSRENIRINVLPKPMKRCYRIGSIVIITIDKSIVEKLGIDPNNTIFEQEITGDGILMRLRKLGDIIRNE